MLHASITRPELLRLTYDDYRARPAIANSDLSKLRDFLNGRGPRSVSNNVALSFGTAFHTALLEPDSYVPGQPGVNDSLVWWMVEAIRHDPDLRQLLEAGIAEPSCIFNDPETGIRCKLRADLVIPTGFANDGFYTVADFKTTMANDWHSFALQCSFFDYDRQAAFYLDALKADRFLLIGVQKIAPYGVFLVGVTPEMLAEGRAKYRALLALLIPGRETNVLPSVNADPVRAAVQALGLQPMTDDDAPR